METRHIKFVLSGMDLDSGEEYHLAAIVAITTERITYTARSADRTQVKTIQTPPEDAPFFLEMIETVGSVCYPDRELA